MSVSLDIIDLFVNDEIKVKLEKLSPWRGCLRGCMRGVKTVIQTDPISFKLCSCTVGVVLKEILDIPKRYDVKVNIKTNLKKQLDTKSNFILLRGEYKYINLVAYNIAKDYINNDQLVKKVETKPFIAPEDIVSINKADLILYEDIYRSKADLAYKSNILKRIGREMPIVFIGESEIAKDDDFIDIDVDSSDLEILDGVK